MQQVVLLPFLCRRITAVFMHPANLIPCLLDQVYSCTRLLHFTVYDNESSTFTARGMSIGISQLKVFGRLIFILPEIDRFWHEKYHVLHFVPHFPQMEKRQITRCFHGAQNLSPYYWTLRTCTRQFALSLLIPAFFTSSMC